MPRLPLSPLRLACLVLTLGVPGCIEVPELDAARDPDLSRAAYPDLVPLGPLLGRTGDPAAEATALETGLTARIARLNQRADALRRRPVIDPATRRRLTRAVQPWIDPSVISLTAPSRSLSDERSRSALARAAIWSGAAPMAHRVSAEQTVRR